MLDYGIDGGMQGLCGTNGTKFKMRVTGWVLSLGPEIVDQTGRGDAGALDWRALNEGGTCMARGQILTDRTPVATGDLTGTLTLITASGNTLGPYNARVKRFQPSRDIAGPNGEECVVHILVGNLISTGTFPVPYVFIQQVKNDIFTFGSLGVLWMFDTAVTAVDVESLGFEIYDGSDWVGPTSATLVSTNVVGFEYTIGGTPAEVTAWRVTTPTGATFANGGNAVVGDGAVTL